MGHLSSTPTELGPLSRKWKCTTTRLPPQYRSSKSEARGQDRNDNGFSKGARYGTRDIEGSRVKEVLEAALKDRVLCLKGYKSFYHWSKARAAASNVAGIKVSFSALLAFSPTRMSCQRWPVTLVPVRPSSTQHITVSCADLQGPAWAGHL